VEGRLLQADDAAGLLGQALDAEAGGAGAVLVAEGPLGDPFVLAAGVSQVVPRILVGVRVTLSPAGRHPTLLARDATSLDLVCGGRSILCFAPPFADAGSLAEAAALCRAMWRDGEAVSAGPRYPVPGAVNRPRPASDASPLLALDLTETSGNGGGHGHGHGDEEDPLLAAVAPDLVLRPTGRPGVSRLERV
jgi:alkanesulfonate monooxygenase SsuD/methylene tetrahydromethanopterin reductase-like flavin-dependent oxidoreductase (luciferase family)